MKLTVAETRTYARLTAKLAAPEPKPVAKKKLATPPKKKAPAAPSKKKPTPTRKASSITY